MKILRRLRRSCTHEDARASKAVEWFWNFCFASKADIRQRIEHVCFVPIADMPNKQPPWPRDKALMGLGWDVGTLVATFAKAGDLFSSFVKRRLHLP